MILFKVTSLETTKDIYSWKHFIIRRKSFEKFKVISNELKISEDRVTLGNNISNCQVFFIASKNKISYMIFLSDMKREKKFFFLLLLLFFETRIYTRLLGLRPDLRFSKATTPPRARDVIDFATGVFRLTETTKLNGRTFRPSLLRDHVSDEPPPLRLLANFPQHGMRQ